MQSSVLIAFAFAVGLAANASADVLYDNLDAANNGEDPISSAEGGPLADSFSTGSSGFSLAEAQILVSGDDTSSGSFTVSLLSDNSRSPGSLLETIGTVDDSSLTSSLSVVDLLLSTPYSLAADTRYWIELSSTNDTTGLWGWSNDTSGPGVAGEYFESGGDVYPNVDGPFQMELSSSDVSSVPEPASIAIFASGLLGLGIALRRRRKAAHRKVSTFN